MNSFFLLADAGIPMLAIVWPGFWLLFVPIVLIETVVARRVLDVPWPKALWLSTQANLVSTLLGIPATWLVLLVVEFLASLVLFLGWHEGNVPPWAEKAAAPFASAWIGDAEPWGVVLAAMWLCVGFFLMSVWVERRVLARHSELPTGAVRRWSWEANIATYSMIEILLGGLLA